MRRNSLRMEPHSSIQLRKGGRGERDGQERREDEAGRLPGDDDEKRAHLVQTTTTAKSSATTNTVWKLTKALGWAMNPCLDFLLER